MTNASHRYINLLFLFIILATTGRIYAQVREDPVVMLAPVLEVFSGSATREEYTIVGMFLVAGGLFAAIVGVNALWVLKQLTFKLFVRIFAAWMLVASGGAIITLVGYITGPQTAPSRADASSMPRDVRANVKDDLIIIQWSTNRPTVGAIRLIGVPNETTLLSNIGKASLYHEVIVPRKHITRLEFVVLSDSLEYRLSGNPLVIEMP